MREDILVALAFAATVVCAHEATADTIIIDNTPVTKDSRTPSGGIGAVGEDSSFESGVAGFYGQTFIAPAATSLVANSLSFEMSWLGYGNGPFGPLKYRVLLVGADSLASVSLNDILFSTPEMLLPQGSGWTSVNVDLGSTPLTAGQNYAWVIDGYSERNGVTGLASVGTANDFNGGNFVFGGYLANSGVDLSQVGLSEIGNGIDLAFQMKFAGIPLAEPAAWALMLVGFGSMGAAIRLARKRGIALTAA